MLNSSLRRSFFFQPSLPRTRVFWCSTTLVAHRLPHAHLKMGDDQSAPLVLALGIRLGQLKELALALLALEMERSTSGRW